MYCNSPLQGVVYVVHLLQCCHSSVCIYCACAVILPFKGSCICVQALQFCHSSVCTYCVCAAILPFKRLYILYCACTAVLRLKGLCMLCMCCNSAIQAFCTYYACAAMLPLTSLCVFGHVLHLYALCMCCKFKWNEFNCAGRFSTVNVLCNAGDLIKCYLKNAWYPLAQILHLRGNDEQTCMYVM